MMSDLNFDAQSRYIYWYMQPDPMHLHLEVIATLFSGIYFQATVHKTGLGNPEWGVDLHVNPHFPQFPFHRIQHCSLIATRQFDLLRDLLKEETPDTLR